MDPLHIRYETAADIVADRSVTIAAFEQSSYGYHGEAELVDAIREQCPTAISLVALFDGELVGHVLFSDARIRGSSGELSGMALGPVAVSPSHQNRGIGAALIRRGLAMISQGESSFTVVIGDPSYYARFGFRPASEFQLRHGFEGIPQAVLQVKCDDFQPLIEISPGEVYYRSEFGAQFESG